MDFQASLPLLLEQLVSLFHKGSPETAIFVDLLGKALFQVFYLFIVAFF